MSTKYLVINRPNGREPEGWTHAGAHKAADMLAEALGNGSVEAAYVLISGGHAYIIEAGSTEELAAKVRYNPLFSQSNTEILPIADAMEYLKGYDQHVLANS